MKKYKIFAVIFTIMFIISICLSIFAVTAGNIYGIISSVLFLICSFIALMLTRFFNNRSK